MTDNNELISIVIPVYNGEKYIERCLESIINQTYQNYEVLVIDDGSNDNTAQIVDQYVCNYKRFKYIYQQNSGVSSARNLGIKESKGKYITFIDSDDWVESEYVSVLIDTIKKYNVPICYCGFNKYIKGKLIKSIRNNNDYEHFSYKDFIPDGYYFYGSCWSGMFDRTCFDTILFPDDISYGEDLITIAKIIKKVNSISFIHIPLYNYEYKHEGSLSGNELFNIKKLDKIKTICSAIDIFNESDKGKRILQGRLAEAAIQMLIHFYYDDNLSEDNKQHLLSIYKNNYGFMDFLDAKGYIKYTALYMFPKIFIPVYTKRKRK